MLANVGCQSHQQVEQSCHGMTRVQLDMYAEVACHKNYGLYLLQMAWRYAYSTWCRMSTTSVGGQPSLLTCASAASLGMGAAMVRSSLCLLVIMCQMQ